jgi:hypothetical protein
MNKLVNSSTPSLKNDVHWVSPVKGEIKINCDAAVGINDSMVAGIARDWRGKLVFAFALKVNTNFPLQAEAEALRQAASIVVSHNIPLVCLESDCKVCIDGILNPSVDVPWRIGTLMNEIKAIVQSIPSASFSWVPRKANMAAHTFARWALTNRFLGFVDESSTLPAVLSKIMEDGCFVS